VHNEIGGDITGNVVQAGHIGSVRIAAPVPTALAGLPPDEGFSGRTAELAVLADALGPHGVPIITVAGPPGVGKSAIAVHAATAAADAYPGGVLFVDLHGYDSARRIDANTALGSLLRALGVRGEHIPADQGERETLYRSELARRTQRMLVVADNASDAEQVLPLRPGDTTHRLLVTSRHTLPLPHARRMEIDVLLPGDSVAVLNDALRAAGDATIGDPAIAAELATLCGHLPLALRITAQLVADQPESAGELAGILRDTRSRLGELAYGDSAAVRAAFDASYQRLPADQARLFRLLSVHPGPHFGRQAASALVAEPLDVTRHLLDGLRRAHLIEPASEPGRYRFHDLLSLYAAQCCRAEERSAAVDGLLEFYGATDITDVERPNFVAVTVLAAATGHDARVLALATTLFPYLNRRQHWPESVTVNECGVQAARRLGDRRQESYCLARLGVTYRGMGLGEQALPRLHEALVIAQDIGDVRAAGATMNSLGAAYRQVGRWAEAEHWLRQGLASCQAVGDRYGEAISLNSLAGVCKALKRLDEALDYYQRALQARRETGDTHGEGMTLSGLGNLNRDLGRHAEALDHFQEALVVRRAAGDEIGEAITLRGIGDTYVGLGRIDVALEHYLLALRGFERANSPRDVEQVQGLIDSVSTAHPPADRRAGIDDPGRTGADRDS
jgi:tetratricopeptide (TPR) repeat protein